MPQNKPLHLTVRSAAPQVNGMALGGLTPGRAPFPRPGGPVPAQRNDQGPSSALLVVMWVVAGGLGLLGVLAVVDLIREGWSWLMFAGALFTFLVAADFGYAAGARRWPEVWWWFLDW